MNSNAGNGGSDPVRVEGSIIFPPSAGTATFGSGAGSDYLALAQAEVTQVGGFEVTLPAEFPAGSGSSLNLVPADLWTDVRRSSCTGQPISSSSSARLRVLDRGSYSVGGVVVGELLPQPFALSGEVTLQNRATMTKLSLYVHADRPVSVQGTVSCTLERTNGEQQKASLEIRYEFRRGWNTVQVQTDSPDDTSPLTTLAQTVPPQPMNWRFLAVQPSGGH